MGSESEPNFGLVFHSRSDARPCSWTLRGEALREGVRYQSYLPSDPSTFASASSPWALPLCQNVPGLEPQDKPPCGFPNGSATTQSKERGRASHLVSLINNHLPLLSVLGSHLESLWVLSCAHHQHGLSVTLCPRRKRAHIARQFWAHKPRSNFKS